MIWRRMEGHKMQIFAIFTIWLWYFNLMIRPYLQTRKGSPNGRLERNRKFNTVTCSSIARERVGNTFPGIQKWQIQILGNQFIAVELTGASMDTDNQHFPLSGFSDKNQVSRKSEISHCQSIIFHVISQSACEEKTRRQPKFSQNGGSLRQLFIMTM